jgi:hypothetical protein
MAQKCGLENRRGELCSNREEKNNSRYVLAEVAFLSALVAMNNPVAETHRPWLRDMRHSMSRSRQ